ncbi:DUF222 domain-containing protein [Antrihabitans cavernicola]|uniref:DUF222 domain-containing protein n=1 Tax=Antrihabitans cavernicola TaxID=2495913 RepID=A0A5A7S8W7_9NOCA|nr:DUF222 domain-containing protein [Spelaeibacter cavernicola]
MFDTEASDEARQLIDQLRAQHRASAVAQAEEVFALTALCRAHVACDLSVGISHPTAGEFAATQAATALHMTEGAVNRLIEIGLALDDDLPLARAAFAIGDMDLAQVRVIVDAIVNVHPDVVAALEKKLVGAAQTQNPSRLRQTARRWIAAHDPDGFPRRTATGCRCADVVDAAARDGEFGLRRGSPHPRSTSGGCSRRTRRRHWLPVIARVAATIAARQLPTLEHHGSRLSTSAYRSTHCSVSVSTRASSTDSARSTPILPACWQRTAAGS